MALRAITFECLLSARHDARIERRLIVLLHRGELVLAISTGLRLLSLTGLRSVL